MCEHADSISGNKGNIAAGDIQWMMTAGRGIHPPGDA